MTRTPTIVFGATLLITASGLTYYGVRRNERRKADLPTDDRNLREDLAVEERVVMSPDGAALLTSEAGDPSGPTVVLPHCWTGSQQIWTPVARRLVRAGCHVIRWDQRGHSRSSIGSLGCTIEALGQDMAAVMAEYDVQDAVLSGHSMGGMTVMEYANDFHEDFERRAKAVVLVDTAAAGMENPATKLAPGVLEQEWLDGWAANPQLGRLMVRATLGTWAAPEHLEVMTQDFVNTSEAGRVDFAADFMQLDLLDSISHIDKPTTILVGALDVLTPIPLARAMHAAIPGSSMRVYPHMGHMLPLENPDAVADAILASVAARYTFVPRQRSDSSVVPQLAEASAPAELPLR